MIILWSQSHHSLLRSHVITQHFSPKERSVVWQCVTITAAKGTTITTAFHFCFVKGDLQCGHKLKVLWYSRLLYEANILANFLPTQTFLLVRNLPCPLRTLCDNFMVIVWWAKRTSVRLLSLGSLYPYRKELGVMLADWLLLTDLRNVVYCFWSFSPRPIFFKWSRCASFAACIAMRVRALSKPYILYRPPLSIFQSLESKRSRMKFSGLKWLRG